MGLAPRYLPRPDYLQRTGYRLPTEAEWEYACRAGAVTPWAHGLSKGLLDQYAWYERNYSGHMHPTGLLKPNDLGLFDMHGNAWEWCQDRYKDFEELPRGTILEDKEDIKDNTDPQKGRLVRGGAFRDRAVFARSAFRLELVPTSRSSNDAFRPARTYR